MKKIYLSIALCLTLLLMAHITACQGQARISENNEVASISETLTENAHLTIEKRIALYHRLKKENPEGYNFKNEDELNMYGYSLLWGDKVAEAIAVFELLVAEFPNSSNPYDSLGEAYLKNGNKEQALANYEKSFELDPENFNAEDQIDQIKRPFIIPETAAEKFVKVHTASDYKEDLDQLGKRLTTVHPNALKFITKDAFWNLIEEKKALITESTTVSEFSWHCSEIIAGINCSHTSLGRFSSEWSMLPVPLRFPLQVRWIDNQLFVVDNVNNENGVAIKDEILSINGIAIDNIIQDIYRHIPSQGFIKTTKRHEFNRWAKGMIPYALRFPEKYEIEVKGKPQPIVLNTAQQNKFKSPFKPACSDNLCFEILDDGKTGLMTIASFNYYPWNNLNVFTDFIDDKFEKIKKEGLENLIIDVRYNGGGAQHASIHLLRYLTDKPFRYYSKAEFAGKDRKIMGEGIQEPHAYTFPGKLYFIIDGMGNSTTGHFMSMVKKWNMGTIVGEELGSNQFCSAGQTVSRLANTKLVYYVANNTHETTATSLPDETGILPDHFVTQSIDDYLNNIDKVKEYTIQLIDK